MPPRHAVIPKAPQPTKIFFDPFNSSSTGHQRAENRLSGSTSWRDSRQYKLAHQFKDGTGRGGEKHVSDLVGAGSEHFGKDGRKDNGDWEVGASGLREKGWQDIRTVFTSSRKRSRDNDEERMGRKKRQLSSESTQPLDKPSLTSPDSASAMATADDEPVEEHPQIFRGLTMYLNGSTMPLVSDHKLKQIWAQHGGNASISLGRRTVTHVILGQQGCGGGLASTKIQKENTRVRGKGIKYVSAQWVLDSIERGIRQPESQYTVAEVRDKLGGSGQQSVATLFRPKSG